MPYIDKLKRPLYNNIVDMYKPIAKSSTVGDLNYLITNLLIEYTKQHGNNYAAINDVAGVMVCAQAEFYRRLAAVYEDKKIKINGDVY